MATTQASSKENNKNTRCTNPSGKKFVHGILVRVDQSRYGKLIEEIENDFLKGHNNYPKNPTEAYNLVVNYKSYGNHNKEIHRQQEV
jgi:hypothetical protein